jgi:predicted Zn-dependent protease
MAAIPAAILPAAIVAFFGLSYTFVWGYAWLTVKVSEMCMDEALGQSEADLDRQLEQAYASANVDQFIQQSPELQNRVQKLTSIIGPTLTNKYLAFMERSMHKHPKRYVKLFKKLQQKGFKTNKTRIINQVARQAQKVIEDSTNNSNSTDLEVQ